MRNYVITTLIKVTKLANQTSLKKNYQHDFLTFVWQNKTFSVKIKALKNVVVVILPFEDAIKIGELNFENTAVYSCSTISSSVTTD